MGNEHIQNVLNELAATAQYIRESGRLIREAVNHLIEAEERIEKNNRFMGVVIERIEKAISEALKAQEHQEGK
jgi:hypothetical protein